MIVAERKPLEEISKMLAGYEEIMILGCGECTTVCFAGGEREVGILASELRMLRKKEKKGITTIEKTIKRQCEVEFVEELKGHIDQVDAILSLGCGAGVQFIAEIFPGKAVYPGLNTKFIGITSESGVWSERCLACGDCILDMTAGICPIARCSKNLLNGPCGGSKDGKCEVDKDLDCAWQMIYDRLKAFGRLKELEEIQPIKDWSGGRDGGPRKVIREDLRI